VNESVDLSEGDADGLRSNAFTELAASFCAWSDTCLTVFLSTQELAPRVTINARIEGNARLV
jgi:hypothetical protein